MKEKRKISFGTVFMLVLTLLVLLGTAYVVNSLSGGQRIDLTKLRPGKLDLQDRYEGPAERREETLTANRVRTGTGGSGGTGEGGESGNGGTGTKESGAAQAFSTGTQSGGSMTLTIGGVTAAEGEIRKNSYLSEFKTYDYSDIMMLLKKELRSDLNIVFLENILSDEYKVSDVIAAGETAGMLKNAGFNAAACGFSKAWSKEAEGIRSTRNILKERGILPLGILEDNGEDPFLMAEQGDVRAAILQYTDTVTTSTRKAMTKKDQGRTIPAPEQEAMEEDIRRAREKGAEAVIVLMHWGRVGKGPDKAQRALAQSIADAGADIIIGAGSRIISGAEELTAAGTGKTVLCVWSVGTLLSGDRSGPAKLGGMLLHLTIRTDGMGGAEIRDVCYTPTYTWKYKQDGRYYYRSLASGGDAPDGMDADQQKSMARAAASVRNAMQGTPVEERISE